MAAPCGCGGSSVVVEGIPPIYVNRAGVRPVTYQVGIGEPGADPCDYINTCVAANLGAGLGYDEATGQFHVRLSRDDGNTLHFGTDSGLKNLAGIEPVPGFCGQSIDDLPPAPEVVGARSLAGLLHPYSSPYGVDYCLAHQLDIVHFQVATSADDVGIVSDYWTNSISGGRSSIYIGQDIRQLESATITSTLNYAGDVDDPVAYQRPDPNSPGGRDDRRGGWWGWLAPRYHQPLASEFLRKINGRSVALMHCVPAPDAHGDEATHIRGAIRAALESCAQQWTMIGVAEVANAETVIANGLTPIMCPDGIALPEAWGSTELPIPPADLTTAGIEWILLSNHHADSVFTAYRDAGLQVLMYTNSRHTDRQRVTDLAIRGGLALDPIYYQGVDSYDYRSTVDGWEHRRPTPGQLTHATDQQLVTSTTGMVRGLPEAHEQGLILPEGFGDSLGRPSIGFWENPLTNSTTYTLTWEMKWTSLAPRNSTVAKAGLLFGADTDASTLDWPDDPEANPRGYPEGQKLLYRAHQRQNGEIGLGKWPSEDSGIEYLALLDSPEMVVGEWNRYTLEVTPTQVTFTRTTPDGQDYTVTTGDTQYRGAYCFFEKEETFYPNPENPFGVKFRSPNYSPGG